MHSVEGLTERQFKVLEAVIQIFVETAQPPEARRSAKPTARAWISPASVRSTMGELETRGFLFPPTPRAGGFPPTAGTGSM